MSKVDDELTHRFRRAERPVGDDELIDGLARRRRRRLTLQRLQAGALAIGVVTATAGGFVALRNAFDNGREPVGNPLPGNGEVVFSRKGDDGHIHLFAARPDGSGERQITDGNTNDSEPAVSPGGETIAFVHELDRGTHIQVIATVPIDGGIVSWHTPENLGATDPVWSPDGGSIAFVGWAEQTVPSGSEAPKRYRAIFTIDATNGRPQRVTDGGIPSTSDPTWSPDGRSIAFAGGSCGSSCETATQSDLYIVDVSSTNVRRLTSMSGEIDEEAPAWSPNGTRIAFTRPGDEGDEVRTIAPDGADETLIATAVDASLEPDLAWAPDWSALLVSDGDWIYRVDATPKGDPRDNFVQLVRGVSPSWQPIPVGSKPPIATSSGPSVSPSPDPEGRDVGLGFNLCDTQRLGGIDFLGDGTSGAAWTGTKVLPDGTCPKAGDGRYGVAADLDGDGIADTWSGETIEYCGSCEPFKAVDLNGDGREELIVILQYFSIMQYGVYTALDVDEKPAIVPFRTGIPGHPQHDLAPGKPFTFWVGGDAGSSDWFWCRSLPRFWLTGTFSPIDGGADAKTKVNETYVSLGNDGVAHILDARTYEVTGQPDLRYATSKPDCGLGVDVWALGFNQ
jgi:hypothetical protein